MSGAGFIDQLRERLEFSSTDVVRLGQTCGDLERAMTERPPRPKVLRFDLSREPHELDAREWSRSKRRDPAEMLGAVLHQWATPVGTTAQSRRKYGGEAAALAHRGLAVPYTLVAGVAPRSGEPIAALCHPIERYTFASDNACGQYVAIGVMGLFPFEESGRTIKHSPVTDALAAAVDECLAWVAELLDAARESTSPPLELITHRQAINGKGDHVQCPGEAVVAMACASDWVRLGAYRPMPDLVLVDDVGKPWPPSWRAHLPVPDQQPEPLPPVV